MNMKNVQKSERNGVEILRFSEIASTNEYAKGQRSFQKDLIVLADRQFGGKGTKGRSFSSEKGGVYLSKLSFPKLPAEQAFEIMAGAATAVCKTLTAYGLKPCIKWPNDIHVGGKKICGILIENTLSGKDVFASVVGIGLNVCNTLPSELSDIATVMSAELIEVPSVDEVANRLIDELCQPVCMDEYLSFLGYMGREAELILGDERIPATLLSVDSEGKLHVRTADGERAFAAAEVSVRGL